MTNEQINALVAEYVIGTTICRCDHSKTPSPRFSSETGHCLTCDKRVVGDYASSPIASKQLRDKLLADGWLYSIQALEPQWPDFNCFACHLWSINAAYESFAYTEERAVATAAYGAYRKTKIQREEIQTKQTGGT